MEGKPRSSIQQIQDRIRSQMTTNTEAVSRTVHEEINEIRAKMEGRIEKTRASITGYSPSTVDRIKQTTNDELDALKQRLDISLIAENITNEQEIFNEVKCSKSQVGKLNEQILSNILQSQQSFQEGESTSHKVAVGKLDSKIMSNILQSQQSFQEEVLSNKQ